MSSRPEASGLRESLRRMAALERLVLVVAGYFNGKAARNKKPPSTTNVVPVM